MSSANRSRSPEDTGERFARFVMAATDPVPEGGTSDILMRADYDVLPGYPAPLTDTTPVP